MMLLARSGSQVRVLSASAAACVGAAALGFLAWRHRPWRCSIIRGQFLKKPQQGSSVEKATHLVNAAEARVFSLKEDIRRCARIEEVLSDLQSLGGASLKGHTLGVPCRHRALVELTGLLTAYRQMLEFGVCGGSLQRASVALQAVIDADRDRHLVFEVGAGRDIPELTALAGVLSEALKRYSCDSARHELDEDYAQIWLQDRTDALSRFKEHIQQCLKAANPWVMYD